MYTEFFNLRELPFNNTPDPRFFYSTPDHEEALASLIYAVQERKGFVLVTGEVGTGKTLVSRMMLRHFGSHIAFANINHAVHDASDLLESVCTDFQIPTDNVDSHAKLIRKLHDFLLSRFAQNIPAVLVLDEAQSLPMEAFEQLRMIGNLEADDAKLLQIVMLGQPELQQRFAKPDLRQLKQRIFRIFHLHGLSREATEGYMRSRLITAGSQDPDIFERDAVDQIFEFSQGLPRLINAVCDNALLSAYSSDCRRIDGAFIRSVIEQMMAVGASDRGQASSPSAQATPPQEAPTVSTPTDCVQGSTGEPNNSAVISTLVQCLATQQTQLSQLTLPVHAPSIPAATPTTPAVDVSAIVEQVTKRVQNLWQQDISLIARRIGEIESTAAMAPAAQERAREAKQLLEELLERVDASTMTVKLQAQELAQREERLQKTAGKVRQIVDSLRQIMDTMKLATTKARHAEKQASRISQRLADQTERARGLVRGINRGFGQIELADRQPPTKHAIVKERSRSAASLGHPSPRPVTSTHSAYDVSDMLAHARDSLTGLREIARGTRRPVEPIPSDLSSPTKQVNAAASTDDPTSQLAAKTDSLLALIESTDAK